MNIRFALFLALGGICSGCATPPEEQPAASASATAAIGAAPTRYRERASITGTRFAPLDDNDPGASSVSAVSKDDYLHDHDAGMHPLCGGDPHRC